MRAIVRNVDESRGAEIAGSADLDTAPYPISVFVVVSLVVTGAGFVMVSMFLRFCRFGVFLVCSVVCIFKTSPVDSCFHASRLLSSRAVGHVAKLTPLPPRLSAAFISRSLSTVFALS